MVWSEVQMLILQTRIMILGLFLFIKSGLVKFHSPSLFATGIWECTPISLFVKMFFKNCAFLAMKRSKPAYLMHWV